LNTNSQSFPHHSSSWDSQQCHWLGNITASVQRTQTQAWSLSATNRSAYPQLPAECNPSLDEVLFWTKCWFHCGTRSL